MTQRRIADGRILRRLGRAGQRLGLIFIGVSMALVARPTAIEAHEIPASVIVRMTVRQDSSAVHVSVRVPLESIRDMDFPLRAGTPYVDLTRADSLLPEAVETWIIPSIKVSAAGSEVAGRLRSTRLTLNGQPVSAGAMVPVQSLALDAELEYPVVASRGVTIDPTLARLGVRTRSVVTFQNLDGSERMFEYLGDPGPLRMNPRWYHAAWQFAALGFEHILDGIDHLLFVLCLVLPFRRLKPLIGIVTAFTVAHSITLIASSLGWAPDALWFPPLVEVLIAASIAWMALENIVMAATGKTGKLERRWLLAFGFGLIHGFGFAFALKESLQFAGKHLALSLLSFNVGVEVGQVAVLAAAVPLLGLLYKRVVAEKIGIIVISAFITHTAWHWLIDRWGALRQYQIEWSLTGMLPLIRVAMALSIGVALAAIIARLIRLRGDVPSVVEGLETRKAAE
jgi:hypothetical protein